LLIEPTLRTVWSKDEDAARRTKQENQSLKPERLVQGNTPYSAVETADNLRFTKSFVFNEDQTYGTAK